MFWTLVTNISLASFQFPSIKLLYLEPYNNTIGEEDWFVVLCAVIKACESKIFGFYQLVTLDENDENSVELLIALYECL